MNGRRFKRLLLLKNNTPLEAQRLPQDTIVLEHNHGSISAYWQQGSYLVGKNIHAIEITSYIKEFHPNWTDEREIKLEAKPASDTESSSSSSSAPVYSGSWDDESDEEPAQETEESKAIIIDKIAKLCGCSTNDQGKLRALFIDKNLRLRPATARITHFVMVPQTPRIVTIHSGLNNFFAADKGMSFYHEQLINIGEATINNLIRDKDLGAGGVCPRVIFPTILSAESEIYKEHCFSHYKSCFNDKQFHTINIHVAAHGSPDRIGSSDVDSRENIENFAEILDLVLAESELGDMKGKNLVFTFHSCNSAYCKLTPGENKEAIKREILQNTLIGKFIQTMRTLGYLNLSVFGFRGFYSHAPTGSIVSSHTEDHAELLPAKTAMFNIQMSAGGDMVVTLPANETGLFFNVNIDPASSHTAKNSSSSSSSSSTSSR